MDKEVKNGFEFCDRSLSQNILAGWQKIIDLTTKISGAYVGLLMGVCHNNIEVLVASKTEGNPYHAGDREHLYGSGLYCEQVIKTMKNLVVPNALKSDEWNQNPDLKNFNLLVYMGFPIRKPDGHPFGTICVLDNKENQFSDEIPILLESMRDLIESQLKIESLHVQNQAQAELLQEKVLQLNHVNQTLKESEEKYKLILENTTDYIWVYNLTQQRFTFVSPSVVNLYGLTVEEALAQKLEDSMDKESFAIVCNKIINGNEHTSCVIEIQQPKKDGELIWVEMTIRYVINPQGEEEIIGVSRNIDQRKKKEQEIYYISTHDYLTDIYNRSYFEQQLQNAVSLKEYSQEPLSLLIIDIDYFKKINDTLGHLAGDEILKFVSQTIATAIRSSDILARYGGEEFSILMPGIDLTNAMSAAERIRTTIENTHFPYDLKITVSIGVTEHDAGQTLDDMYRHADTALYNGKENGRNQVVVYRGLDA